MIVFGRITPPASSFIAAAHWPTTFSQTAISANHARTGTTCITRGALSWKPPWIVSEEEKDTPIGLAYDPAAVDRFFEKRPERVGARTAQTSSWTGRTTASTWRVRVRIREVGDRQRRLSSGMRLPEGPNVSVEFHGHRRLKELKDKLDEHFADLQKFTLKVDAQEVTTMTRDMFMKNFTNDKGALVAMERQWTKYRVCPFFCKVGNWNGHEAYQLAAVVCESIPARVLAR